MCLPSHIRCACKGNSGLWFCARGTATLALVSGFFICSICLTAAVSGFLVCSQWLANFWEVLFFCSWWDPSVLWVTGVHHWPEVMLRFSHWYYRGVWSFLLHNENLFLQNWCKDAEASPSQALIFRELPYPERLLLPSNLLWLGISP